MKKQYFLPLLTLSLSLLVFLNINLDFANAQCMPPYGCGSEGYTPPGGDIETTNVNIVFDTSGNYLGDTVPAGSKVLSTAPGTLTTPGYDPDTGQDQIYGSTIITVGTESESGGSGHPPPQNRTPPPPSGETPSGGGGGSGHPHRTPPPPSGETPSGGGGGCGNGGETPGGETPGGETPGGETPGGETPSTTEPCYKTCYVKVCHGCCCRTDPKTVKCEESCPGDQCSSHCDCCRRNGSCYPRVFLNIDPPKLFVNQSFNLSYRAEGNSCCGNLQCTLTSTYQGFNCGQSGMIGICPSDAQGVNVCDPKNQLSKINLTGKTLYVGTISITTHSQYWGNCLYSLNCKNNCGLPQSDTQTVMTVPVPLWGEESPISNLLSPLKPLISLFPL